MASLYPKKVGGKTYWYLREMGRVDGKPKMISERYLGTAADIAAAMETREAAALPDRTRHLAFGDIAAAWGILEDLGVAAVIDEVTGSTGRGGAVRRHLPGAGGAEPAGRPLLQGGVRELVEDHRRRPAGQDPGPGAGSPVLLGTRCTPFTLEQLEEISRTIAVGIVGLSGVDVSSVALDMTNFATFIATANGKAPVAQGGKAKQKRFDLRLVGLGLVVTRDGGIPLSLARLPRRPARRDPVPRHARPAAHPVPGGHRRSRGPGRGRGHDRGLQTARTAQDSSATWPSTTCTTSGRCPPRTVRT